MLTGNGSFSGGYRFRLSQSQRLADYPSGSAITFYDHQFWIVGDDAPSVLVTDDHFRKIRTVQVENHPEPRIPKPIKPDYECSALISDHRRPSLLIVGSASTDQRKKIILLPLTNHERQIERFDSSAFISRLLRLGIGEVNLEGVTMVGDLVVLVNRGNLGYPHNHFIVTDSGFWKHQETAPIRIIPAGTFAGVTGFSGISDLFYLPQRDLLLLSYSSEQTTNVYDDGAIGVSYLGWIGSFRTRMTSDSWVPDAMMSLPEIDPAFRGQKIEGLCAEINPEGNLLVQLVSDNDTGDTGVFELMQY